MIEPKKSNEIGHTSDSFPRSRRKRTPSQFAQSIDQLKKGTLKLQRKSKMSGQEESDPQLSGCTSQQGHGLSCFLPRRNKKIRLRIVIKKPKIRKEKESKQLGSGDLAKIEPVEQQKNKNLLEALFKLCEEHKMDEQLRIKQNEAKSEEQANSSDNTVAKVGRSRRTREDEQKYSRMYDRYVFLTQKLEQFDTQTFMI